MKEKLLPLESLRGVAALVIAIYHFPTLSPLWANPFTANGYLMVDIFFVISGFVIALGYWDRISAPRDVGNFLVRRFWRLYPLHFATLAFFVLFETAQWVVEPYRGSVGAEPAFSRNDFTAFLTNLSLTHGLLENELTFNGPSWSISIEFFAYLAFALSLLVRGRPRWALLASVWCLSAGVVVVLNGGYLDLTHGLTSLCRCLFGFLLGAAASRIYRSRIFAEARPTYTLATLGLCILAVVFLGRTPWEWTLTLLFAAAVLQLALLPRGSTIDRWLSAPWLVFLGTVSYSVYLIHTPVYAVLWAAAKVASIDVNALPPLPATALTLAVTATVLIISRWTYALIERRWLAGYTGILPPVPALPRAPQPGVSLPQA